VIQLRPAVPEDAVALAALAREAFGAAFGTLYRPEDLEAFLTEYRSPARYAEYIGDPATRIMLADEDGKLLAYCLIVMGQQFDEHPEPRPARPVFLSQLYCAGEATGRGLGGRLMDWAIGEARGWGADAITLSVYADNHGAQRFYQRLGFAHVADIFFWVGSKRDDEFLYQLDL
jgi:GNAT superfamily N-acetyltransferase